MTARRRAAGAALGVLFLALIWQAGRLALADFHTQSARLAIDAWSQPQRGVRGGEWARVTGHLERSLALVPGHPWALEELAWLDLAQMRTATRPQAAQASARRAYLRLREALRLRPTSPFPWASLALAKLYLGEIDAELFDALARALALGPWEPEVLETAVFVGLAAWRKADDDRRAMIVRAIERGVRRDAGRITKVLAQYNRLDLVCDTNPGLAGGACGAERRGRR